MEVGQKYDAFSKIWADDEECFKAVKDQYIRMLSSTPDARASQWRKKIGIDEPKQSSPTVDEMQVDS